jgi:predicted nucleic acid-binding protein
MLGRNKYIKIRREYFGETSLEASNNFIKYKKVKMRLDSLKCKKVELVDCPTAQPTPVWNTPMPGCCSKEEGKTPMRYNDNYAHASVTAPQSDTAVTRDYLNGRLVQAFGLKEREFHTIFNLYVDNTPKTYKEMIDAIKNDKFKIDPKVERRLADAEDDKDEDSFRFYGPMSGIIWDGPQPDRKGYEAACTEMDKQYRKANDAVMVKSAEDGLAAIEAFEAWLPTKADTAQ